MKTILGVPLAALTRFERRALEKERKDTISADHQEVPRPSALGSQEVGTAEHEARRRRQLNQARAQQRAPQLLLRLDQQEAKARRPRAPKV